tara:strand:- start:134 stop:355 length:222 start_codon:yes stop_codon:yes gene_type:complete
LACSPRSPRRWAVLVVVVVVVVAVVRVRVRVAAQPEQVRYLAITPMVAQPEEAGEDLLVLTSYYLYLLLTTYY